MQNRRYDPKRFMVGEYNFGKMNTMEKKGINLAFKLHAEIPCLGKAIIST